jgi:hypothetical protein
VIPKPLVFVGTNMTRATLEVAVRPNSEARRVTHDEVIFCDLIANVRQMKTVIHCIGR